MLFLREMTESTCVMQWRWVIGEKKLFFFGILLFFCFDYFFYWENRIYFEFFWGGNFLIGRDDRPIVRLSVESVPSSLFKMIYIGRVAHERTKRKKYKTTIHNHNHTFSLMYYQTFINKTGMNVTKKGETCWLFVCWIVDYRVDNEFGLIVYFKYTINILLIR